jgi:flagellar basal body rod protein FlgG
MEGKTMMDMMQGMFEAENIGSGKYLVKFIPTKQGYYTMHTHVIPAGKSMMSMMNNHMDIGLISK